MINNSLLEKAQNQALLDDAIFMLAIAAAPEVGFFRCGETGEFTFLSKSVSWLCKNIECFQIGRNMDESLTMDECNNAIRSMDWHADKDPHVAHFECKFLDKYSRTRRLNIWKTRVRWNGKLIGFIGFVRIRDTEVDLSNTVRLIDKANQLSSVERQTIQLVYEGKLNKEIAKTLGVALRTVECRRASAMKKFNLSTHAELIRVWMLLQSYGY